MKPAGLVWVPLVTTFVTSASHLTFHCHFPPTPFNQYYSYRVYHIRVVGGFCGLVTVNMCQGLLRTQCVLAVCRMCCSSVAEVLLDALNALHTVVTQIFCQCSAKTILHQILTFLCLDIKMFEGQIFGPVIWVFLGTLTSHLGCLGGVLPLL